MKNFFLGIVATVLILGMYFVGKYAATHTLELSSTVNQTTATVVPTGSLVGNDRDEHGCIGSAGYSWCEIKQKCLRSWEEACSTATVSPSRDETETLKTEIKQQLVAKHGASANSLIVTVSTIEGNYAKGMASEQGGGGIWFAAKVNGSWKLIFDGNGIITCNDLTNYPDFPVTLIPQCYDSMTQKMVTR